MNKFFFVIALVLLSACDDTGNKATSKSVNRMNDYKINGLLGNVKKKTAHSYHNPIKKDKKWVPGDTPYFTHVTHYNNNGFKTREETYTYDMGKMALSSKIIYEYKNGLPASAIIYNNDTISDVETIEYINDTIYKVNFKNSPSSLSMNELRNNGKLFVSTHTYREDSTGIKVIVLHTQTYNNKGNIISYHDKRTCTQHDKPLEGIDMNYESNTSSGVISYDNKGNIAEELLTTQGKDEAFSEIRRIEYEYY